MAQDLTGMLRSAAVNMAQDTLKNFRSGGDGKPKKGSSPLSGMKGLAAGAALAGLAPLAKKGFDLARSPGGAVSAVGDKVGGKLKETVSEKVDDAGGVGGIAKQAAGGLLAGGGDGSGGGGGKPGVGKGRRMPIQQSVDIGLPVETVYNQFTQFEEWPQFMHRVTRVTQEDECTLSFEAKIWTRKREFTAEIETQRPDQRIKWSVSQGLTHTGVVTFHELGPNLTRVLLSFDVEPGGMIEKIARGARHIKRAARADLHRFKAFIETQEHETGAWRGVIEDGELVEEHDPSYDEERDYSDIEDLEPEVEGDDADNANGEGEEQEEEPKKPRQPARAKRSTVRRSGSAASSGRNGASASRSSKSSKPRRQAARR